MLFNDLVNKSMSRKERSLTAGHGYPHRLFCGAIGDMQDVLKSTGILSILRLRPLLISLVAEVQVYGNRMEAGLEYSRDISELHDIRAKLILEIKELEAKKKALDSSKKKPTT